jgi:hypothetical protein
MNTNDQLAQPLSNRTLVWMFLVALIVATFIVVLVVLPAEFRVDLTGFGRLTGLNRMAEPLPPTAQVLAAPTKTAPFYTIPFRVDRIDIPLAAIDGELEYKVRMRTGDTMTYSWEVEGIPNPDEFYFDFHGEVPPRAPGEKIRVEEYHQQKGTRSSGALVAPFEGVHGWYLQNQSDKPGVMHLTVSGFYELISPGEYGNEAGIQPLRQ